MSAWHTDADLFHQRKEARRRAWAQGIALKKKETNALISSGQVQHEVIDVGEKGSASIAEYKIDI